jgi:hypothetical protein
MAKIEGYNMKGEVVEIFEDFEDFRNYWSSISTEKLEEILKSHVDVVNFSGNRVKYYYVEETPEEKPNAFDKEFNITNAPINILLKTGHYGCDTKKYFDTRNAKLKEMCDNSHQEERRSKYCSNGSDLDIDKYPNIPLQGLGGKDGGEYDEKGNSSHYQSQFMEFVRDQERKYGTIVAMIVCQSNVDKYNQRVGRKEGVPAEKDLIKRDWYFKAMTHFKKKVEAVKKGAGYLPGRNSYVPMAEEVVDLIRTDFPGELATIPKYIPLSTAIEK